MMKQNYFIFFLLMVCTADLWGQQSSVASGGSGSGTGGTNEFSVGQVVYTQISGTGGIATQGVQQPYEIYVLDDEGHPNIKLEALVYPNPTESDINLRIVTATPQVFDYELFDIQGRLLLQNKSNGIETRIPMARYPLGTYILKVHSGKSILKSFKIIKNER